MGEQMKDLAIGVENARPPETRAAGKRETKRDMRSTGASGGRASITPPKGKDDSGGVVKEIRARPRFRGMDDDASGTRNEENR